MPCAHKNKRRSIRTLVSLALILVPFTAQADQSAQNLLAQVASTARSTRTLRANVLLTRIVAGKPELHASGSVLLMKPNLALIQLTGNDEAVPALLASDGKSLFNFSDLNTYSKDPVDAHATQLNEPWWGLPFRYFFTQSAAVFTGVPDPAAVTTLLPDEVINGEPFHVLSVQGTAPFPYVQKLYINLRNILQRTVVHFGPTTTFSAELTNIKLNEPLSARSFQFVPPAQAKLKQQDPTATMLALNTVAPPFRLPSLDALPVSLASQRNGRKATLVNFWYLDCPPCRIEFPEFEKLYQQFRAQGFNVVAIDRGDAAADVRSYVHKAGLTFPILLGGEETRTSVFAQYKATAFPVTYLLDADGRIVYRAAGEDIAGLRQALTNLGFK